MDRTFSRRWTWGFFGRFAVMATIVVVPTFIVEAADVDPKELMRKADKRHRFPNESGEAVMVLQAGTGEQRNRSFEFFYIQDDAGGDRLWIRFTAPGDIKGTTFLTIENKGSDDEQWIYLPAFSRTRRIGTAELGDRFVGSDLFYDDLKRRYVDDYKYEMLREEKCGTHDCWVIEGIPIAPEVVRDSPYGKIVIWLRKDTLVVPKWRFFDRRMRPWKEAIWDEFVPAKGEAYRPNKITVVDIQRKHRTVLNNLKRDVNKEPAVDQFSQHKLAN